jgi:alpha-beta hydrolase superfamily lysophospholipase
LVIASAPMRSSEFTHQASDGKGLFVYRFLPDEGAKVLAVVHISHGMAEHAARYARVAESLTAAGYAVYANDHRGHGKTASTDELGFFASEHGFGRVVADLAELVAHEKKEHPGLPVVLFGHSMGSMIAQSYLQRWGSGLKAAVLSGSMGGIPLDEATLGFIESTGQGEAADQPSEMFAAMFAGMNEPFAKDGATGFEWLSRDDAEVKKYVDDPWCGFPLSNGYVADMMIAMNTTWQPASEANVAKGVPILVMSGEEDPVGGEKAASVKELVGRYEANGVGPVTLTLYPGGRHEMLNETNRDDVEADIVRWLDSVIDA